METEGSMGRVEAEDALTGGDLAYAAARGLVAAGVLFACGECLARRCSSNGKDSMRPSKRKGDINGGFVVTSVR